VRTGPIAETRLSHLICPRRFRVEAGFGTWSPVRCQAGRGGCRGFIGPVPLPLSIRLPMNIAGWGHRVKRFSAARVTGRSRRWCFRSLWARVASHCSALSSGWETIHRWHRFPQIGGAAFGVVGLHPHRDTGHGGNPNSSRVGWISYPDR
jgi:hypothetical protein